MSNQEPVLYTDYIDFLTDRINVETGLINETKTKAVLLDAEYVLSFDYKILYKIFRLGCYKNRPYSWQEQDTVYYANRNLKLLTDEMREIMYNRKVQIICGSQYEMIENRHNELFYKWAEMNNRPQGV